MAAYSAAGQRSRAGVVTLIWRADALDSVLAALAAGFGAATLLPATDVHMRMVDECRAPPRPMVVPARRLLLIEARADQRGRSIDRNRLHVTPFA